MEKPRTRKAKTIQMKYPAPYSQSWTSPEPPRKQEKPKKKAKKNTSSLQQNLFPGCCRRPRPKPLHGCDPYAPHLKYGIFPRTQKSRTVLTTVNVKPSDRTTTEPSTAAEFLECKAESKKAKKGQLSDTPLFVIRPIDKRHRRQLSMSETLHLDIKPRKSIPNSPRKYSPLFKNAIPRMNTTIEY